MCAIRQPARRSENKPFSPGGGGGGRTASSSRLRSRVKSVWRTFCFLLQQRRSVSISAGLNEGLVSSATGYRSTGLGVCVYYQSALVSTAGYIQRPLLSPSSPPLPSHKRSHLQERVPTPPSVPSPPSVHKSGRRFGHTALAHRRMITYTSVAIRARRADNST